MIPTAAAATDIVAVEMMICGLLFTCAITGVATVKGVRFDEKHPALNWIIHFF